MSTTSRDLARTPAAESSLPFTGPWLLAPMEGVTEPVFRELVLQRNAADQLGGAFTEFVRQQTEEVVKEYSDLNDLKDMDVSGQKFTLLLLGKTT